MKKQISTKKIKQNNQALWTPLHLASSCGNYEVVKFLIENEANLDSQNEGGQGALHYACSKGHEQIAFALLDYNSLTYTENNLKTELKNSSIQKSPEKKTININLQDKSKATPLMRAIVNGNILIVEKILSLKANLELQDNDGNTALHYACYENKGQIAQILLNAQGKSVYQK